MPERSFGRVVRYRRTKLGLSQAKLGQLVGRSPATVRSWESDKSIPNDPKVLATLAAILGVDERSMFNKAGVELLAVVETSPTIEEALATLAPEGSEPVPTAGVVAAFHELESDQEPVVEEEAKSASVLVESKVPPDMEGPEGLGPDLLIDLAPEPEAPPVEPRHLPVPMPAAPIGAPPPIPHPVTASREPYIYTVPPSTTEPSYIEESSQKQLYRVRTLATVVGLVALVIALLWATTEGLDALGTWWDDFTGTLRL